MASRLYAFELAVAKNGERVKSINDELVAFKKWTELGVKPGVENWKNIAGEGPQSEKVLLS